MGGEQEQRAQPLARIRNIFQAAKDILLLKQLPALQCCLQQGVTRRKMPVEAALGHAQPARQRLHRHRANALFGNHVQRRLRPVIGAQALVAPAARRLFAGSEGIGCHCWI